MGKIRDEVLVDHLSQYPQERQLLVPFLSNFDVTWARRRHAKNTHLSVYHLLPDETVQDQFGFGSERSY